VDKDTLIKVVIAGVVVYVGYSYLQSSGLWAQWFGGTPAPNPLPGTQTLLTSGTPPVTTSGTPAPQPTTPTGVTAAQLLAAAGATNNPSQTGNVDFWNYYEKQVNPNAQVTDLGLPTATTRGPLMTVTQYIAARQAAGLSGFRQRSPYNLGNVSWRVQ